MTAALHAYLAACDNRRLFADVVRDLTIVFGLTDRQAQRAITEFALTQWDEGGEVMDRLNTILDNWLSFERLDIPANAPPVQRNAMRKAFYSGAASMMMLSCKAADKARSGDVAQLEALANELRQFS